MKNVLDMAVAVAMNPALDLVVRSRAELLIANITGTGLGTVWGGIDYARSQTRH